MKQSRFMSWVEAWGNVAIGFGINFGANLLVLPVFGLPVTMTTAFGIGVVFTVISVLRSFLLRRLFEAIRIHKGNWK